MDSQSHDSHARSDGDYLVVARRYRPQAFDELIGQEHIAQALAGAIASNRIGHAYLFTGARGVGKTSAARIFAKALNCERGPTAEPCNACEVCRGITSGDDIDVLEIDGASNRGIDEMRELRHNVGIRPSRARFKVYIIDEVHMLTREAFNALLKTLEEPPEHVKFVFCTTEPEKIPITILSRCQRFDFAGVQTAAIAQRLAQIVEAEGVEAEREALELLAVRAAGSMRDSQSLLEQLLSFCGPKISVADVHRMLGTAADDRLGNLIERIMAHDTAGALAAVDRAILEGVDPSQLVEQLLGYCRDLMVAAAGCPAESLVHVANGSRAAVREAGQRMSIDTVLAAMQILDQTLARLRYSSHARTLAELAVVRLCRLDELESVTRLIEALQSGEFESGEPARLVHAAPHATRSTASAEPAAPVSAAVPSLAQSLANSIDAPPATKTADAQAEPGSPSKKNEAASSDAASIAAQPVAAPPAAADAPNGMHPKGLRAEADTAPPAAVDREQVLAAWQNLVAETHGFLGDHLRLAESAAISAPNRLVVAFLPHYNFQKQFCERPEHHSRLEFAVSQAVGMPIKIDFVLRAGDESAASKMRTTAMRDAAPDAAQRPFVRRAVELFEARVLGVTKP